MVIDRIVSFLPSATELLYELDAENNLFGVTHECRYPPDATTKPRVINSVIDSDRLTSNEINSMTCKLLNDGKDIFVLDEENLKKADPDLLISQETCEVCAAYTNQVNKAVQILEKKPILHSMNPHNLQEILESITQLGKILEKDNKAKKVREKLEKRIRNISKIDIQQKPTVLAIEWLEPFFTAGHWIPEMIEQAGGINLISKTGENSRRLNFEEIKNADPDLLILMPCGFDVKRTISEYNEILKTNSDWNGLRAVKNNQVFAVDANSFFSKPSIRTINGLEILAKIFHPEKVNQILISEESFLKIE